MGGIYGCSGQALLGYGMCRRLGGANCSEILGAEDYFCDGNGVRMAFSELFLSAILTFLCNKLSPKKQITNFETNLGVIQL